MISHSSGVFVRATQKLCRFSSVTLLGGKVSRTEDAVTGLRYDKSIQPVKSSFRSVHLRVGRYCGKSPKRVLENICPSSSKPAGNIETRRSKVQLVASHGVPEFQKLP